MSQLKKALEKKIQKQFERGSLSPEEIEYMTQTAAIRLKEKRLAAKRMAETNRQG